MNIINKVLPIGIILALFAGCLVLNTARAAASSNSNLIGDSVFDNTNSMTASQIDSWLNTHFPNSCISTNNGFSAPDPTGYSPDANFTDGHYTYGGAVSAGRVIYDAAKAHGINPQVLITKLQNEEGLVDGSAYYGCGALAMSAAVGYACTDSGTFAHNYSYVAGADPYTNPSALVTPLYYHNGTPINSISGTCVNQNVKAGFSQQVVHAAWLLSFSRHKSEGQTSWAAVNGSWNHCEDNGSCSAELNIPANWACYSGYMTQGFYKRCPSDASTTYYDGYATIDGTSVHIDTGATAALYVYTPHFQSFDSIFTPWFGSPSGSTLFKISGNSTYYLEWGSYYYPIPSSEILNAYGLQRVAPRTLASFPSGETAGPTLQRVVKFGSDNTNSSDYTATIDLVEGGKFHDAPNWTTLNSHGYSSYLSYPASLRWVLSSGDALRPVVKASSGAYYLMEGGKKRLFPDWTTFSTLSGANYAGTNQVYSQQSVTNVANEYTDSKDNGAPMLLDGKFIKPAGSATIYLYDSGKKYAFDSNTYYSWGRKLDYQFTSAAIDQIQSGGNAPVLVSSISDNNLYLIDSAKKKLFSDSGLAAWGLDKSQFTPVTDATLSRLDNGKVLNLLAGPDRTVFQVGSAAKHGIPSAVDFNNLGFSWSGVDDVGNSTLSLLPNGPTLFYTGSLLRTPNGAVYVVDSGYTALGINSGTLFKRYGLSWNNVRNVGDNALNGYAVNSLQTLIKNNSDGSYYEVDNGVKHLVDANTFGAGEYDMAAWPYNAVDGRIINNIKSGQQLSQFLQGSGPTVYYIQGGQKHGITSSAKFTNLGGNWSNVVKVSDTFLSELPTGANM